MHTFQMWEGKRGREKKKERHVVKIIQTRRKKGKGETLGGKKESLSFSRRKSHSAYL